ncbi:ATP-binding protein [Psychroserpens sp. XS_ASV72]|uniref:ATP-binding protein n=1 Tax=Psychroserpens sp. XS_ASV72 TaxID=3241293 RepID=UPI003513A556
MNSHSWPIKPTQITSDYSDYDDNNVNFLTGVGIIPNNHLRGLFQYLNVDKNYCTGIYEYSFETDRLAITNGFYENPLLKNYCIIKNKINRNEEGKKDFIKSIFKKEIRLDNNKIKFINCDKERFKYYELRFLEYSYSNYYIPIIIEDVVIGVIELSDLQTNRVFEIRSNNEIESLKQFYKLNNIELIKQVSFEESHDGLFYKVDRIQTLLLKKLFEIRKNFINYHNKFFNDLLRETFDQKSCDVDSFWGLVKNVLDRVIEVFPAKSLRIFATEIITKGNSQNFKLVMSTVTGEISKSKRKNFRYLVDSSKFKKRIETSINNPKLLDKIYLDGEKFTDLDPRFDLVRVYTSPFAKNASLIIWITYDEFKWDRLNELETNKESEQVFANLIVSFYSFLSSLYTSMISSASLEKLNDIIKIDSHEMDNLAMSMELNRSRFISTQTQINRLTPERFEILNNNFESLLRQLKVLSNLSKNILTSNLRPKRDYFFPYGVLLFKWKNLFSTKCRRSKNEIVFPYNHKDIHRSPKYYGDQLMIEAIIYNMLSNAHKYSHRGTKIELDYSYDIIKNEYIFKFVNYFSEMDKSRSKYDIFRRGGNVVNSNSYKGLGVGLFLCEKIAQAHGGSIEDEQVEISKFNVPFIIPFLKKVRPNIDVSKDVYDQIKNEFERLTENRINRIVAKNEKGEALYNPSVNTILDMIFDPTIKIIFKLKLK